MTGHKPWCWEADHRGEGPDWQFVAHVTPAHETALVRAALQTTLNGYAYFTGDPTYCPIHGHHCTHHTFIDTCNLDAYISNYLGKDHQNMWIYNRLQIHHDVIEIECGYGGRSKRHSLTETDFLFSLFQRPDIDLHSWEIFVGGNGYDHKLLCAGSDLQDLQSYVAPARHQVLSVGLHA